MRYGDMPICMCVICVHYFESQLGLMLDKRKTLACLWVPCHISANLAYVYSTEPYSTIACHSNPLFEILMNYD